MLGYLEVHLMIDGELPPDFQKRKDAVVADANVKAFLGTFRPKNEEQGRRSVAALTRLEPLAGDKAYVVGILRANLESRLGNVETATSLFVAALKANPFLTGVWKDLGDSLDTGYDAADTWRCYEIARLIDPRHSVLAGVTEREASLAKAHPEYF